MTTVKTAVPVLAWSEFTARYLETQEGTPDSLAETLRAHVLCFTPEGFMILQCAMLDSSLCGQRVIMPYGPNNTFKTPPEHPVSPRGLASDMSTVECVMPASNVPAIMHSEPAAELGFSAAPAQLYDDTVQLKYPNSDTEVPHA